MKLLKRLAPFEILLILSILGVHLYAAFADGYNFANLWFIRDDAYYYFKVAQNISEGYGSSFDRINLTNGYHPLWLLINIPIFTLARYDLILPLRVLLVFIALLHAATAILIYRLLARSLSQAVAIWAACYWAFNGYIHFAFYRPGLETPLAAFAVILLMERLSDFESHWRKEKITAQRISGLAFLAVLAMFSRLDLVFLAFIVGIFVTFRGHPLRYLLPFDLVIFFFSMMSAVALRVGFPAYNGLSATALLAAALAVIFNVLAYYFIGLYQHPRGQSLGGILPRVGLASALGGGISAALIQLAAWSGWTAGIPRAAFFYSWLLTAALTFLLRASARWFGKQRLNPNLSRPTPLAELRLNWKNWLADGAAYYGMVGGALALYMAYNKIYFGTSSPVSGQIKRWWGHLLHTVYDTPAANGWDFMGIAYEGPYNIWQPISHTFLELAIRIKPLYPGSNTQDERYHIVLFVFALAVLLLFFWNKRKTMRAVAQTAFAPLLAGAALHTLSYTATSYGGAKEWYWVSQVLLTILGLSIALDLILKPLQKYPLARRVLVAVALGFGAFWAIQLDSFIINNMRRGVTPPDQPYMDVVAYLEENTRAGAVIGMTGGGNVGYFIQDRTIVNMDGLINSYEYFQALQNEDVVNYHYQRGMRVIFSNSKLLTYPPYNGQFNRYISVYSSYGGKSLMWLLPEPKW